MEIKIKSPSGVTLLTEKKYCTENINVVPELQDKAVTPAATEQSVSADTGYAGLGTVTVAPVATESGAATPSAAAQVITPSEGKLFDKFTVNATPTETKSVTPTTAEQTVTPTEGKFLSSVSVAAIEVEEKAATPTAAAQDVTPSAGKYLSKVTVNATPTEQKTITGNGTFTPSTGKFFDSVTVNVNTAKPEQEKSVELTTMTPVDVTPDEGYTLSKVTATPKAPLADTSDATATLHELLSGKTAYAKGKKITGGIETRRGSKSCTFKETLPDAIALYYPGVFETTNGWIAFERIQTTAETDGSKTMVAYLFYATGETRELLNIYSTATGWSTGITRNFVFDDRTDLTPYSAYFDKGPTAVGPYVDVTSAKGTSLSSSGYYFNANTSIYPSTTDLTVIPSASAQTKVPSGAYVGYNKVTVNAAPLDAAKTVTAGTGVTTVNPTGSNIGIKSVTVNPTPSSAKTATPTKETQTVSPDSGKLLSGVTVNPIPAEYIIPSGTKDITANGTTDVTSFASVNVAVPAPDLSDATATAGKVLLGFTAYTGAGKITGTIPTYTGLIRPDDPTMPVKGDIITMDSRQYRVLKISGKIAEVLAMYDASSSQKFDTNSSYNNTYAGKNIDTYCNSTFYSGLSSAMKGAIVDKTFTQDSWSRVSSVPTPSHYTGKDTDGNLYYLVLANATYRESITRHCYCLSVQDVLDYLDATTSMGTSDTTLTGTNVLQMFWNVTTAQSGKYIWLRSAYSVYSSDAFYVNGSNGYLSHSYVDAARAVRPAFQIDLSKVEWTK